MVRLPVNAVLLLVKMVIIVYTLGDELLLDRNDLCRVCTPPNVYGFVRGHSSQPVCLTPRLYSTNIDVSVWFAF